MKKIKKILIISIILTLLTNYISIISEVSNVVYATVHELTSISDLEEKDIEVNTIADVSSRYKGIFYSNLILSEKKDFVFTTNTKLKVNVFEKVHSITINESNLIEKADNTEIEINNMSYKSVSINAEEFNKVLGENGYIEIYNELGEKISEINSQTEIIDEQYRYVCSEGIKKLSFKVSKFESNAELNIKIEKAITGNNEFSKQDILDFKAIKIKNEYIIEKEDLEETKDEIIE